MHFFDTDSLTPECCAKLEQLEAAIRDQDEGAFSALLAGTTQADLRALLEKELRNRVLIPISQPD